ncbi:FHA domain-containing protein [bacterium]|nr:FHA domain-containing protein [bacterium]
MTDHPSTSLTIHLIDSAKGQVVQTWRFQGCDRVVIGRAPDCDIRLADQLVSRVHVEFHRDPTNDQWTLKSLGRNGTIVNGNAVTEIVTKDRMIFQLGPSGPRFQSLLTQEANADWAATVIGTNDMGILEMLKIDEKKKLEEVSRIMEGDNFRHLLAKAKELRQAKHDPSITLQPDPSETIDPV